MFLPAIAQCKKCLNVKTADLFYKASGIQINKKTRLRSSCKKCMDDRNRQWKEKNPEQTKQAYVKGNKKRYGLTIEQYDKMVTRQKNVCAICKLPDTFKLSVDHNHSCCSDPIKSCGLCIRGLLCGNCNRGLGLFKDNPKFVKAALDYLERHQ